MCYLAALCKGFHFETFKATIKSLSTMTVLRILPNNIISLNDGTIFTYWEIPTNHALTRRKNKGIIVPQRNQVFVGNKCKEVLDGSATIFWRSTTPLFLVGFGPSQLHPCEGCPQPPSCQIPPHTWSLMNLVAQLTSPSEEFLSTLQVYHAMFLQLLDSYLSETPIRKTMEKHRQ